MPIVLLERLPLPSLRAYSSFSIVLLSCAVYYAHQVITDNNNGAGNSTTASNATNNTNSSSLSSSIRRNITHDPDEYVVDMVKILLEETWCVWTLINMAYCCLIMVGKVIQRAIFGELRVSEQQHIKDKFWNFVFYKFIFIFGVMNVQNMDEVVMWCAWFSVLGFLHLLAQLCKDRFEYLSFSPTTPQWTHFRVLGLLAIIQLTCFSLFVLCIMVGFTAGINTFAFMAAECILLIIKTMYVICRYGIHLLDLNYDGVWENRALYVYYTQLVFELAALSVDFAHHLHMLVWSNIFLSMASLVICMQLRYLFHEFQRRIKRHKNYLHVVNSMEARFPMASKEDLQQNSDDCAICWDKMETARKLPCSHMFHNACLRSWLEQDTSCPTCRTSLNDPQEGDPNGNDPTPAPEPDVQLAAHEPRPVNQTINHFFHFDGSRYVSWLPSFSVEVTHTQIMGNARNNQVQTSQLDNMARQVQSVFPSMPLSPIIEDLRVTRSVEQTIDNILEGRLVAPPQSLTRSLTDSAQSSEDESTEDIAPSEDIVVEPPRSHYNNQQDHGLNFIMDDNLPNIVDEQPVQDQAENIPESIPGFRFSKSPNERESMLSMRKDEMMQQARRRFLARETTGNTPVNQPDAASVVSNQSNPEADANERRERAYQAARRRMQDL